MLSEWWNSFNANMKERVTNPFLSVFSFSVLLVNYKAILYFFWGGNPEPKIQAIQALYPSWDIKLKFFLCYPALSSFLFIIFYPLLNIAATSIWLFLQKAVIATRRSIEKTEIADQASYRRLRLEYIALDESLKEVKEHNESLRQLIVTLNKNDSENSEVADNDSAETEAEEEFSDALLSDQKTAVVRLKPLEHELLRRTAKSLAKPGSSGAVDVDSLKRSFYKDKEYDADNICVQHAIDELVKYSLINDQGPSISLRPEGREYYARFVNGKDAFSSISISLGLNVAPPYTVLLEN